MRRLVLVVLGLLGMGVPAGGQAATNEVGVCSHIPATGITELIGDLGAHWNRLDNNWLQHADPCSADIGVFAPLENSVADSLDRGVRVYMTLAYGPACASTGDAGGDGPNNDVPDPTLYASYVRQAVAHYRAMGVTHFGLWNEANLGQFFEGSAQQYVSNVVVPGIPAVADGCADAGFSDCMALGPDLAHVGDYDVFMEDTLNAMNAAGVEFDIFTHHIYQGHDTQIFEGDAFLNALEERRFAFTRRSMLDVLKDTGNTDANGEPNFEVWITETGYRAQPATDAAEMSYQKDHTMWTIDEQLARDWWTNTFFYEIVDAPGLDGFGITRDNNDGTFFSKPAYIALQDRILTDPGLNNEPQPVEPPTLLTKRTLDRVTVDGDLGEWTEAIFETMTSPDHWISAGGAPGDAADLSARFAALWTPEALYLAIEVTDQTHFNAQTDSDLLWAGDSIQAAFDVARNGGDAYDDTDDYEMGWALGVGSHRWVAPAGAAAATGTHAVVRDGTTTRYEIALPVADLGLAGLTIADELGFTMLVNDDDGAGRLGWIEWTPGIGAGKTPDAFGHFELVDENGNPGDPLDPNDPNDPSNPADPPLIPSACTCALSPHAHTPESAASLLLLALTASVVALRRRSHRRRRRTERRHVTGCRCGENR